MQEDEKFLSEVFAQLTDEATDDDKRRELVSYLFKVYKICCFYMYFRKLVRCSNVCVSAYHEGIWVLYKSQNHVGGFY